MRRSRSETVATKQRIVAAASRLFLDRGLDAVGMRDVMAAADLTAGGFYRHFASKDELIAEAMQFTFDRLFAMFETEIQGKTLAQALERIVTLYLQQTPNSREGSSPYLCPLAQLGSQLRRSAPLVRAVAIGGHARFVTLIATCLGHRSTAEIKADARTIVSMLVGAVTLDELGADAKAAIGTRALARKTILEQYKPVSRP